MARWRWHSKDQTYSYFHTFTTNELDAAHDILFHLDQLIEFLGKLYRTEVSHPAGFTMLKNEAYLGRRHRQFVFSKHVRDHHRDQRVFLTWCSKEVEAGFELRLCQQIDNLMEAAIVRTYVATLLVRASGAWNRCDAS